MSGIGKLKADFESVLKNIPLILYEETDSTNDAAKEFAKATRAKSPAVFIAARQRAGRGRLGRSFSSEQGGLYMSYLSYPETRPEDAIRLTVYAAVCVCKTVEEMTGASPKIKWINDVWLGGRKISGILTEGAFSEDGSRFAYAVTGIGVNIRKREFCSELSGIATDIESECGIRLSIGQFAARLTEKLSAFESADPAVYMNEYRERCFIIGRKIKVISTEGEYTATARDVSDDGFLTVERENGEICHLFAGEVSLKIN